MLPKTVAKEEKYMYIYIYIYIYMRTTWYQSGVAEGVESCGDGLVVSERSSCGDAARGGVEEGHQVAPEGLQRCRRLHTRHAAHEVATVLHRRGDDRLGWGLRLGRFGLTRFRFRHGAARGCGSGRMQEESSLVGVTQGATLGLPNAQSGAEEGRARILELGELHLTLARGIGQDDIARRRVGFTGTRALATTCKHTRCAPPKKNKADKI